MVKKKKAKELFNDMTLAQLERATRELAEALEEPGAVLEAEELLGDALTVSQGTLDLIDHHKICTKALDVERARLDLIRKGLAHKAGG